MTPFDLLLCALASYRGTRLISTDTLTEPPRDWLYRRLPIYLGDALRCPFCVGVWASVATLLVFLHAGRVGYWLVVGAAVAGGQALASGVDGALND